MSRRKFSTSKPFETNDITSNSSAKKDIKIMIAEVKTFIERLNKITFKVIDFGNHKFNIVLFIVVSIKHV